MRARFSLISYTVPITLTLVIAATGPSSPAYAANRDKKNTNSAYLLLQNTVWAANHRLIISPALMQLNAEHQEFSVQYSVKDQMICAWHRNRKEYAKEPLQSWLKSFRNLAVMLSWTSGLPKPNEVTPVVEWGRKAKLYVFDDVKIARSYYSSDIGQRERKKEPAIGHIKTIRLDGVDPKVGLVLTRLYGFPESNEIPIEAYLLRNNKKSHDAIHTVKLEANPEIKLPSPFVPSKDYKQIKDFQRILAPQDTDVNGIF